MLKIQFVYSDVYLKKFHMKEPVKASALEGAVRQRGKELEELFQKHKELILGKIEEYSGRSWSACGKEVIYVYPVIYPGKSFSDPLTISLKDNGSLNLVILIHELIHSIVAESIEHDHQETAINKITKSIIQNINDEALMKAFEQFEKWFTTPLTER